jgi:hypothetical protein
MCERRFYIEKLNLEKWVTRRVVYEYQKKNKIEDKLVEKTHKK